MLLNWEYDLCALQLGKHMCVLPLHIVGNPEYFGKLTVQGVVGYWKHIIFYYR